MLFQLSDIQINIRPTKELPLFLSGSKFSFITRQEFQCEKIQQNPRLCSVTMFFTPGASVSKKSRFLQYLSQTASLGLSFGKDCGYGE